MAEEVRQRRAEMLPAILTPDVGVLGPSLEPDLGGRAHWLPPGQCVAIAFEKRGMCTCTVSFKCEGSTLFAPVSTTLAFQYARRCADTTHHYYIYI
eukprot:1812765-Rhodomonas_salina.3